MHIRDSFRSTHRSLGILAGLLCLLVLRHRWQQESDPITRVPTAEAHIPACHSLPRANDVLVSLKTDSVGLQDIFGVHLRTTLECYLHRLVFSDYAEEVDGESIIDALEYVNDSIKAIHENFDLWRRLQTYGRKVWTVVELSGTHGKEKDESARIQDLSWKLDKWKFLLMIKRALHEFSTKH